MSLRIATWNLERPKMRGAVKNRALLAQLNDVDADLWVLTETNEAITPPGYAIEATPAVPGYHGQGENYTSILSRWPITRRIPTWQPALAVCVEIASPIGLCIVYGTIIAYANYRGIDGTSGRWVEHRRSIEIHRAEWKRLRAQYPEHSFVVAGDFNQSRDGSGWYEDAASISALTGTLAECELACVTEANFREEYGLSRANIDHICLGGSLRNRTMHIDAWPGTDGNGKRLSDHNGVVVAVHC